MLVIFDCKHLFGKWSEEEVKGVTYSGLLRKIVPKYKLFVLEAKKIESRLIFMFLEGIFSYDPLYHLL